MEKREYPRLNVAANCTVSGIETGELPGVTRNLSRTGVLFELIRQPDLPLPCVGQELVVELQLPVNPVFGAVRLRCRGSVVRVFSARGCAPRIAVQFSDLRFRRGPKVVAMSDHAANGGRE